MDLSKICFSVRWEIRIRLSVSPDGVPAVTIYRVICFSPTDMKQCYYILTPCMLGLILDFAFYNSLPVGVYIWSLEISNTLCSKFPKTQEMMCLLSRQDSRPLWWFYLGLNSCLRWWLVRNKGIRIRNFLPTMRCNHILSGFSGFTLPHWKEKMKNELTSFVENQLMIMMRILMIITTILVELGSLNMLFHLSFQQLINYHIYPHIT